MLVVAIVQSFVTAAELKPYTVWQRTLPDTEQCVVGVS